MGPIGSPETSVYNHLTPRNNPEDKIIQFNSGVSIPSRVLMVVWLSELYKGGQVVLLHTMKAYRDGGIGPLILSLRPTWRWASSLCPFTTGKNRSLEASENRSLEASENRSLEAWENRSLEAWENRSLEAWEKGGSLISLALLSMSNSALCCVGLFFQWYFHLVWIKSH